MGKKKKKRRRKIVVKPRNTFMDSVLRIVLMIAVLAIGMALVANAWWSIDQILSRDEVCYFRGFFRFCMTWGNKPHRMIEALAGHALTLVFVAYFVVMSVQSYLERRRKKKKLQQTRQQPALSAAARLQSVGSGPTRD